MAVDRPMNVILFLTDQLRKDCLGAYGSSIVKSPNLDRLSREGVRFERAYTQNPFCSPARASILTGLHPRSHGLWHNGIRFLVGAPTLGDMLQQQGYRTGSVGKIHLNPWFGAAPPAQFEESQNYWKNHPEMNDWHGPYCGFQEVELVIGHVHYSASGGHYSHYIDTVFPKGRELLQRASSPAPNEYRDTWRNAIPKEHHYNGWIADRSIEMIDRFTGGPSGEPFFMHVSFPDPHHPFSACEPYSTMYPESEVPEPMVDDPAEFEAMPPLYGDQYFGRSNSYTQHPPSFPEQLKGGPVRALRSQTYGMITHVDEEIGRIISHLESRSLLHNTLIIFTSDHGELLGDHGFVYKGPFYYQQLLNVPLIMRGPGLSPEVRSDLCGHVDIVPTIMRLIGTEPSAHLPGRPLFQEADSSSGWTDTAGPDVVLTEFRPFDCPNMKVIHSGHWKYAYYGGQPYGEFFDLATDPEERRNLFSDPRFSAKRAEMHSILLDELVRTEAAWPMRGPWQ